MNLKELREKSKKLNEDIQTGQVSKVERKVDERSWYPKLAEDGSSTSIIRFLPMSIEMLQAGHKKHWVTEHRHNFKGPKGWVDEKCRTMLESKDEPCPFCEENRENWDDNDESVKAAVRKSGRLRQTKHYANILVIDDKGNPDNNGQVKYFKFGKEILQIVLEAAKRDENDPDSEPKLPFDLDVGHDFVLKTTRNNYKQIEYKASKFKERARPVATTEEEIDAIWKKAIDLREFVKLSDVKSYETLKARLDAVNGVSSSSSSNTTSSAPATTRQTKVEQVQDEMEVDEELLRQLAEE